MKYFPYTGSWFSISILSINSSEGFITNFFTLAFFKITPPFAIIELARRSAICPPPSTKRQDPSKKELLN
jgi:hypothetical protein